MTDDISDTKELSSFYYCSYQFNLLLYFYLSTDNLLFIDFLSFPLHLAPFYSSLFFLSKYYFGSFITFSPQLLNFIKYFWSYSTNGLFRMHMLIFDCPFYCVLCPTAAIFLKGANLFESKTKLFSMFRYLSLLKGIRLLNVPCSWLKPRSSSSKEYILGKCSKLRKSQWVMESDLRFWY